MMNFKSFTVDFVITGCFVFMLTNASFALEYTTSRGRRQERRQPGTVHKGDAAKGRTKAPPQARPTPAGAEAQPQRKAPFFYYSGKRSRNQGENTMKQISLRLPEELYEELSKRGDKINCSTNSMIMFLIHLGLKIYDGDAVIHQSEFE